MFAVRRQPSGFPWLAAPGLWRFRRHAMEGPVEQFHRVDGPNRQARLAQPPTDLQQAANVPRGEQVGPDSSETLEPSALYRTHEALFALAHAI